MLEAILTVVYIITVSVSARIYWKIRKESEPDLGKHPDEWFRYKKETEGNILYILTFPVSAPFILTLNLVLVMARWIFHITVVIPSNRLYPRIRKIAERYKN